MSDCNDPADGFAAHQDCALKLSADCCDPDDLQPMEYLDQLITEARAEAALVCLRHRNCAYSGREPERCPACHRSWDMITGPDERLGAYQSRTQKHPYDPRPSGLVRALHTRAHEKDDAPRSKGNQLNAREGSTASG